jgi:16S rRNA (guanine1207-N2)-methyltransferase
MKSELRRWVLGTPSVVASDDGVVGLTAADLLAARGRVGLAVGLHEAMGTVLPKARERVDVYLPVYRGKTFIPVLSWLVATRLSSVHSNAIWHIDKQQGPNSVMNLLTGLGWKLDRERRGRETLLIGRPPADAILPEPRDFVAEIGAERLRLAADYGVFSPGEVDMGTELLLQVALRGPAVEVLADIGIGYGPLAIGLIRNGIACRSVATDIDCVALWLAQRNAEANEVPLEVICSPDATMVAPTHLTVCNVPTHINAEQTQALMKGLLRRARQGRLLTVVHASLEARYARYFFDSGFPVTRHAGATHIVLDSAH